MVETGMNWLGWGWTRKAGSGVDRSSVEWAGLGWFARINILPMPI